MVDSPLRLTVEDDALILDLGDVYRCLSSAVLNGGSGEIRTWLNVQVPRDYARTDPAEHLRGVSRERRLAEPVVGMLTAALVRDHAVARHGAARAVATVGVRDSLAAAGSLPEVVAPAGTINVLAVLDAPLTDAALVGAIATATEAKTQALVEAGVPASNGPGAATGTATDSICVACMPGSLVEFAGTATVIGNELAHAVYETVSTGLERYMDWRRKNEPGPRT